MTDSVSNLHRASTARTNASVYTMPIESARHVRTWMQWPAHVAIYEEVYDLDLVRADLARLAQTIAQFEPVMMLARPDQAERAQRRCGPTVQVVPMAVDDLWARDSGPSFVRHVSGETVVLDFQFSGWGRKQACDADAQVARRVAEYLSVQHLDAGFVGEGGGIESDGAGTILTTESCLLNANRNPGRTREEINLAMAAGLGAQCVVWLPGMAGVDITDGHIDGIARIVSPGVVLFEKPDSAKDAVWAAMVEASISVLENSTDARGRSFECLTVQSPRHVRSSEPEFLDAYCNYYVCNGAVIAPQFGDTRADADAAAVLRECYPGRDVVQLNVDRIYENGGGIHCATQQQPE